MGLHVSKNNKITYIDIILAYLQAYMRNTRIRLHEFLIMFLKIFCLTEQ